MIIELGATTDKNCAKRNSDKTFESSEQSE